MIRTKLSRLLSKFNIPHLKKSNSLVKNKKKLKLKLMMKNLNINITNKSKRMTLSSKLPLIYSDRKIDSE